MVWSDCLCACPSWKMLHDRKPNRKAEVGLKHYVHIFYQHPFSKTCFSCIKSGHLSRRVLQWRQRDKCRWSWRPDRCTLLHSDRAAARIRSCLQGAHNREIYVLSIEFATKKLNGKVWNSKRLLPKTSSWIKITELPFWKRRVSETRCLVLRLIPSHVDTRIRELCRAW